MQFGVSLLVSEQVQFLANNSEDYCNVDVGCYESDGVYSRRQIKEAHDSFQPREMLNFAQQLALMPLTEMAEQSLLGRAMVMASALPLWDRPAVPMPMSLLVLTG
ncbi:Hypothetical predicted protein [Olea europaea subsp. europaea]|uniref:Uncharacterized protein n=1 Tax=Olea europaea subsp. europaea TaxID=158383 RepID=A0A8S0TN01_OLEEU|nr:Hypothetical predicted protein [Olea europaea subsp. europaea]